MGSSTRVQTHYFSILFECSNSFTVSIEHIDVCVAWSISLEKLFSVIPAEMSSSLKCIKWSIWAASWLSITSKNNKITLFLYYMYDRRDLSNLIKDLLHWRSIYEMRKSNWHHILEQVEIIRKLIFDFLVIYQFTEEFSTVLKIKGDLNSKERIGWFSQFSSLECIWED